MTGLVFAGLLTAAAASTLDPGRVPESASDAAGFVPKGWALEHEQNADLDGDGRDDLVLMVLADGQPVGDNEPPEDRNRALIVALADPKGGFRRVGVGPGVLLCKSCAGMLGSFDDEDHGDVVTIEKNVIVISELAGSRIGNAWTLRVRWDAKARRMRLIGRDETTYDRTAGGSVSISQNYLTGARVVEVEKGGDPAALPDAKPGRTKEKPREIWLEDAKLSEAL